MGLRPVHGERAQEPQLIGWRVLSPLVAHHHGSMFRLEGDASWWAALLAPALLAPTLLVAAAAVTVSVGERLCRPSLLQIGGRTGLRQAWRAQD
jgi:hypothetical protein